MMEKICFDLRKSLSFEEITFIWIDYSYHFYYDKVCKHSFYAITITTNLTCTSDEKQIIGSRENNGSLITILPIIKL